MRRSFALRIARFVTATIFVGFHLFGGNLIFVALAMASLFAAHLAWAHFDLARASAIVFFATTNVIAGIRITFTLQG
jgi:hypothetical protein